MKHLPFNHGWIPLGSFTQNGDPWGQTSCEWKGSTSLTLMCDCGKVKTKVIAWFPMTKEQIATYIERVYT